MPVSGVKGRMISANPLMISSSFLSARSRGGRSGIFLSLMLRYATTDSMIWVVVNDEDDIAVPVMCIMMGTIVLIITINMAVKAIVTASLVCGSRKRTAQNGARTSSISTGANEGCIVAIRFTIVKVSLFTGLFVKRQR